MKLWSKWIKYALISMEKLVKYVKISKNLRGGGVVHLRWEGGGQF